MTPTRYTPDAPAAALAHPGQFPRIPDLGPRALAEPLAAYSYRALAHALDHGTAGLDDDALALALAASQSAVTAPGLLEHTRERFSDVRRSMMLAAACRARMAAADAPAAAGPADDGPAAGGSKVPALPRPVGPSAPDDLPFVL